MVKDVTAIDKEDQFNSIISVAFDHTPVLVEHPKHFDPMSLANLSFIANFDLRLSEHELALFNQFLQAAGLRRAI